MRNSSFIALAIATLLSCNAACSDNSEGSYQRPRVWPKPTDPPPASPVYHDVREAMPGEEEIAREAAGHNAQLEAGIETALLKGDIQKREAAVVFLLPELLQVEPARVVGLLARLPPGEGRNQLRIEMARLWIAQDPASGQRWLKSLDKGERREAVLAVVADLLPWAPQDAARLAEECGLAQEPQVRKLLSALR